MTDPAIPGALRSASKIADRAAGAATQSKGRTKLDRVGDGWKGRTRGKVEDDLARVRKHLGRAEGSLESLADALRGAASIVDRIIAAEQQAAIDRQRAAAEKAVSDP